MTIVIPEDDNINEILIDVRDILSGTYLNSEAEKELEYITRGLNDDLDFLSEFVFTLKKSEFGFDLNDESFVNNINNLKKRDIKSKLEAILQKLYCDTERPLNKIRGDNNKFNLRYINHIKKRYNNTFKFKSCRIIIMKESNRVILGENLNDSHVQLIEVYIDDLSKKIEFDFSEIDKQNESTGQVSHDLKRIGVDGLKVVKVKDLVKYLRKRKQEIDEKIIINEFIKNKLLSYENTKTL